MTKRRWWFRSTLGCSVCVAIVLITGCGTQASTPLPKAKALIAPNAGSPTSTPGSKSPAPVTVDVFGGSMAYGWKDPHNNSYLRRAFALEARTTHINYRYINHAIPGFTARWLNHKYPGRFNQWLSHDKPQVVVLSWGLENDISSTHHDSLQSFGNNLRGEISLGLRHHAVVLIVTPPVTKLLMTADHKKVTEYINKEFEVAKAFHSNNVVDMNVYQQMLSYMNLHHQTYQPYFGNSWHPNQAGHKLAGEILAQDLIKRFGKGPIQFQNSTTTPVQSLVKSTHI